MLIHELITELDRIFPPGLQEKYDNTGKQVIFSDDRIRNILVSLDIDEDVLKEAEQKDCNLILSHHPFLFRPISMLDSSEPDSEIIMRLVQNKISLFSIHTNLDKIFYKKAAEVIGLPDGDVIFPESNSPVEATVGLGSLSYLKEPLPLKELILTVKDKLKMKYIVYCGDPNAMIESVAVVNGAGGNSIHKIIPQKKPSCIITGDVGFHHAKYAQRHGVALIDAGHFGTERILLDFLKDDLLVCLTNKSDSKHININISQEEKNPFNVIMETEPDKKI